MDRDELAHRFGYHPPTTPLVGELHSSIRDNCWDLANFLNYWLPDSREKSLAITHLEEVMYWSNAIIARSQDAAGGHIAESGD